MGVIDLDRLEVRLGGRTVLDGLTGELRGNAIGLLGPNGAGKSTLINTLLGFHVPSRGTARVFGMDAVRDRARIRQSIGYMPENDSFIGNMSGVRLCPLHGRARRPALRAKPSSAPTKPCSTSASAKCATARSAPTRWA